ncbi:hypothetical protein I3843_04G112300 [Carya illinoinensis]|uniref:Uncharacterized protein n=1 Tax=Carya illinoinensis TaxID=32201 RepID=A0A8T1QSJ3_CARIL|nr:hypothetical protein I3760_04G121300 [Carya illinoinensis]KAG6657908.1 hypothetical protein CIPAW_04G122600 [Carya illinoinensis]KAG6717843.1 hypothetical protein I3842_04G120200 [Carya illinoinensis]KAG7983561.1 hypothetical protein I3843_04G112300 [Carya illinoinensis]
MNYLNRVWMAASVAVVQGHADQGHKLKSGANSLQLGRRKFFSGNNDSSDLRPLSGMVGSDLDGFLGSSDIEDRKRQAEESLRRVMYFNCWGLG